MCTLEMLSRAYFREAGKAPRALQGPQSRRAGHMPKPPEEEEVVGRKSTEGRHGSSCAR